MIGDGESGASHRSERDILFGCAEREDSIDDLAGSRGVLGDLAGFKNRIDDRPAGPVEAWRFGGIERDQAVVDLHSGERGNNVFDEFNDDAIASDGGPPLSWQYELASGRDRL